MDVLLCGMNLGRVIHAVEWDWTNLAQIKFRSPQSAHGTATTAHGNNNYRTHSAWIPPQPNPALPIPTRRRRAACDGESFYARWPATGRDEPRGGSGLRVDAIATGWERKVSVLVRHQCACVLSACYFSYRRRRRLLLARLLPPPLPPPARLPPLNHNSADSAFARYLPICPYLLSFV